MFDPLTETEVQQLVSSEAVDELIDAIGRLIHFPAIEEGPLLGDVEDILREALTKIKALTVS
jgi:hypothetical protein